MADDLFRRRHTRNKPVRFRQFLKLQRRNRLSPLFRSARPQSPARLRRFLRILRTE